VRIRQISGGGSSRAYVNAGVGSFRRIALNGGDDETIGEVVERIEEVLAEMATRLAALTRILKVVACACLCQYRLLDRSNIAQT
jgi:hypothetical protein